MVWWFLKNLKIELLYNLAILLQHIQVYKISVLRSYLYVYVHCSIIQNSPEKEYRHKRILFILKNEKSPVMDEPKGQAVC
jgi:hypothetical protein